MRPPDGKRRLLLASMLIAACAAESSPLHLPPGQEHLQDLADNAACRVQLVDVARHVRRNAARNPRITPGCEIAMIRHVRECFGLASSSLTGRGRRQCDLRMITEYSSCLEPEGGRVARQTVIDEAIALQLGHMPGDCRDHAILAGDPHGSWPWDYCSSLGLRSLAEIYDTESLFAEGALASADASVLTARWERFMRALQRQAARRECLDPMADAFLYAIGMGGAP